MNKIKFLLLLLMLPILAVTQSAEVLLEQTVDRLKLAMINADKKELDVLTANELTYGHSSGAVDTKAEFIEKLMTGKSDFVSIDITKQTITLSGKTAIVRHILNAKTNDGGKPGEVSLNVLLVWQKQKKQWKLIARQAVKIVK